MDYHKTLESIEPGDLEGFFEGWPNSPDPETHYRILENSHAIVVAVDASGEDDGRPAVAGFVNAVSDGILAAYLPLLEVRPAYRGRGLGSALVERMKAELDGLYMIDAVCDPEVAPFYENLGFEELAGMAYRDYDHQRGR